MPSVSLQRMPRKFQEKSSDLEALLLELGFLCEKNAVGQTAASFSYNAHGSMTSMPHLSAMDWDFAEKLCHITRGTTEAYYSYDGSGIRTRKVVEKNGVVETRLYLGGFEIWRKTVNGVLDTERETLHVMDDQKRIALVETLTVENGNRVAAPAPVQRYQLDNHLGSASLELDDSANIISYEEYYPYGDTSYRAGRNASEVSRKRYRYTGKEKDEESSLYYCEQRYYAAHISRWVSTDPTWLEDGINLYAYVNGNPVSGVDPSGMGTENNDDVVKPVLDENNKGEKASISKIKKEIEIEDKESLKNRFINEPLEIDSYDDLPTGILLSQKEKGALIQEYINVLSEAGEDTQWLEDLKNIDFQINKAHYPKKVKFKGDEVGLPRAWTDKNEVTFNTGLIGENNESLQIDSPKGKALLLHELRHIWQSNNPEWKEKYAAKDIDIEVDAFDMQYRFEKLTGVENEGRKIFDNLDEFARKHGYDFEKTRELKAKELWKNHGYGNPKMKYTNHYIQEKK